MKRLMLGAALTVMVALAALSGCENQNTAGPTPGVTPSPTASATPVADVLRDPSGLFDKPVRVTGVVDAVVAPFAFTITAPENYTPTPTETPTTPTGTVTPAAATTPTGTPTA